MSESDKSLRSPLGRARFLGSARRGSQDAWLTHVTMVARRWYTHTVSGAGSIHATCPTRAALP